MPSKHSPVLGSALRAALMGPELEDVRRLAAELAPFLTRTPSIRCLPVEAELGDGSQVFGKLEFLQRTGTFKARGALTAMLGLGTSEREAGVTAVSAGNHAIAVAFAAAALGSTAKVVMLRSSNAERVARCVALGAEVVVADDVHSAFDTVKRIEHEEGRFFVHPFDGPDIARGTATLGLELMEQVPNLDAVVVPIGGGGLCAGVASAVKQCNPACAVYGVEPLGADSMYRSFHSNEPQRIDRVDTIADSLGAPYALRYSFELCRSNVDNIVRVADAELSAAMRFLFRRMKFAVEPACAATTAALLGPLAGSLRGHRVGLVFCGSNIDWRSYARDARWDGDSAD